MSFPGCTKKVGLKTENRIPQYLTSVCLRSYCYVNGNDLILFNIKNDKTKAILTHRYIGLVISKPTTTTFV